MYNGRSSSIAICSTRCDRGCSAGKTIFLAFGIKQFGRVYRCSVGDRVQISSRYACGRTSGDAICSRGRILINSTTVSRPLNSRYETPQQLAPLSSAQHLHAFEVNISKHPQLELFINVGLEMDWIKNSDRLRQPSQLVLAFSHIHKPTLVPEHTMQT